jgi:hypothetical protein
MTHTKDEALKLALEALEGIHPGNMTPMAEEYWNKAITAINQALEQPVQEPVGEIEQIDIDDDGQASAWLRLHNDVEVGQLLYTTPPAQPAVPDAFGTREGEHPEYIQGWNDCRAEMLKGMKP